MRSGLSCSKISIMLVNPTALRKAKIVYNFGLLSATGLTQHYIFKCTVCKNTTIFCKKKKAHIFQFLHFHILALVKKLFINFINKMML